jgi:hypothetical protein
MQAMMDNFYNVFNHSSYDQYLDGLNWYGEARDYAKHLSQEHSVPFISVAAVIAALSPMSPWERNKLDASMMVSNNTEHKYTTFGANVAKAKRLLHMTDYSAIVDELNGLKTIAFFDNIFNEESELITIDSHMLSIAYGKKLSKSERPSMSKTLYQTIESGIRSMADRFNLRPYELQAILWVTWRTI